MSTNNKTEQLRNIWAAYKNGMRKSTMMELLNMTEEEVTSLLDEAQEMFGKGPLAPKEEVQVKHVPKPLFEPEEWVRPKAKYSNKSWDETIDELINTPI